MNNFATGLSMFRFVLIVYAAVTVAAADAYAKDDLVDYATDTSELGSIIANSFGKQGAAKSLGKLTGLGTGISIVQNVKDGNIPGVVGDLAEAGTAFWTVPTGIAAGTAAGGPVGGSIGGAAGMAVADYRGKQAEEYTRQIIEKYRDRRTDLQKRMDSVGLDYKSIANDFGNLRQLGQSAKYEAEIRKRLLALERQRAITNGESYFDDAMTKQEIAELEQFAIDAQANQMVFPYDSNQTSTLSSTIPFTPGQGIVCGPISAAERAQIQTELGMDVAKLEERVQRARSNYQRTKRTYSAHARKGIITREGAAAEIGASEDWYEGSRNALKRVVVELRAKNGYCPAPIGTSAQQVSPGSSNAVGRQSAPAQSGDNTFPSGGNTIPNGCVRMSQIGYCQCGGDVRQC